MRVALIIALLFPAEEKVGFMSVGSLMMLGLYLLSTLLALAAGCRESSAPAPASHSPVLVEPTIADCLQSSAARRNQALSARVGGTGTSRLRSIAASSRSPSAVAGRPGASGPST